MLIDLAKINLPLVIFILCFVSFYFYTKKT